MFMAMYLDEELYYQCHRTQDEQQHHIAKVVRTPQEANDIFVEFHGSAIGAHCGIDKTMHAIIQRYYWPGMRADIMKWVSALFVLYLFGAHGIYVMLSFAFKVSEPFELVGMDLVGPLKRSNSGYMYICVMVDYFTKWLEVYPLMSKRAEEVTVCIMDFFYKYGAPKRILTDRGKEFVNKTNQGLCEKLGIARSLCTDSMCSNFRALRKMVHDHQSDWENFIKPTVFGIRTKKQITTKYSPYFLMYGREARYPSEIPLLWQPYLFFAIMCTSAQTRVRKRKLAKGDDDNFVVGDKVLRKNICQEQRKGGKLETDFFGPFTIKHIDGKSADLKSITGKTILKINIDQLKQYVEPEPRIPAKWIAMTSSAPLALESNPLTCPSIPQSPTCKQSRPRSDPLPSSLQSTSVTPEECKYISVTFYLSSNIL
uniref:Integrase catalytic domain-containing protein n=1 Tax=Labrus bergylta TaxID=56723 RepID=A0A3Q3FUA3_9LABR